MGLIMLRLSKLTDYAVVVLIRLAGGAEVQTAPQIALSTGVPEPTVAKVLKALTAANLVLSSRGAKGGYRLASALTDIPISRVIAAIDGPIALTACVEGSGVVCSTQHHCPASGRWNLVNGAIQTALNSISLGDMAAVSLPRGMGLDMFDQNLAAEELRP
jgi:FeS assembly SUF system regulator